MRILGGAGLELEGLAEGGLAEGGLQLTKIEKCYLMHHLNERRVQLCIFRNKSNPMQ